MMPTEEEIKDMLLKSRKSVLFEHRDNILMLREKGVTLVVIQKWLETEHKITTTMENIRQFCLRNTQAGVYKAKELNENKDSSKRDPFINLLKESE